ncbi:MAG: glycogen/starch synthase, partial [Clostridia bacterium]|nr:glycogen/starch synthase [Clostridia bacterium]
MKKILFVGAEAMPFAATGGLGDVMGSLPAAIKAAAGDNVDVRVVMPYYSIMSEAIKAECETVTEFYVSLAWRRQYCGIKQLVRDGVTYYFIDNKYYFYRDTLYGNYDDGERFAFFCRAVLDMLGKIDFYPDILHANDWQSALSVVYLNNGYKNIPEYSNIKTIFTIHNIEYQGKYDTAILWDVFGLGWETKGLMEFDGCINLMKGAVMCADKVTTVSQRYSEEICTPEYSHGLDRIFNMSPAKLCGILNGIDYSYYNPATDKDIVENFTWRSLPKKAKNKLALQEEYGLPTREDVPMIAIISRLASHKGLDIVKECLASIVENNDLQVVVLGKGENVYESFFTELEARYPDKVKALMIYDRALSKRVYAAADIFMMPSKSEPCGLS